MYVQMYNHSNRDLGDKFLKRFRYFVFIDRPKLKTVWQSLHDCMLKYKTQLIFSINKFLIVFIHVFNLSFVHENQISILFLKIFPELRFELLYCTLVSYIVS